MGVSLGAWFVSILFLAALAGAAYFLVRIVRQGQGRSFEAAGMKLLGRLPLALNQSLVLVALGEHVLLLGVGQRVELLERIDDPELVAQLLREGPKSAAPFAGAISRLQEQDFRSFLEESVRRVREGRSLRGGKRDEDA